MKINYYSFKNLLIGFGFGLIPISLLIGVFSLLGFSPVFFNETEYYGIKGLLVSIVISFLMTLLLSCMCYIFLNLGVFIYNIINPNNWFVVARTKGKNKSRAGKEQQKSQSNEQ